jgi:hypothetical protein
MLLVFISRIFRVYLWAGIAQSIQRLATGSTVWESIPGFGRDFPHPFRPALGAHQASYTVCTPLSPGVKAAWSFF